MKYTYTFKVAGTEHNTFVWSMVIAKWYSIFHKMMCVNQNYLDNIYDRKNLHW